MTTQNTVLLIGGLGLGGIVLYEVMKPPAKPATIIQQAPAPAPVAQQTPSGLGGLLGPIISLIA